MEEDEEVVEGGGSLVVLFNDISMFIGYLMPKTSL